MDNKICGRCGKEIPGEDEVYCPDCKKDVRRNSRKRLWYSAVIAVILLLAGSVFWYGDKNSWDFSWDSLLRRPVAVINGEPVARSDLRERFTVSRLMLEREYGKELFAGEQGRALLAHMERDVLEKMLYERLVAHEARRMNIQVGDERVKQELQRIGREIYGTWENFQSSLREEGISPKYLSDHVRNLILRQEVEKAMAPPGADPDEYFGAWLVEARQKASITFNKTVVPLRVSSPVRGGCCGTGLGGGGGRGGGGCGTKQAGALDPELESKASVAALAEYWKNSPAEKGVEAKVADYGCHIQVDIMKGGRIAKSYAYQDGKVTDN